MSQTELDQWKQAIDQLSQDIEQWAKSRGWSVERSQKQLTESRLGAYAVPVLSIKTPTGQVHLEPVARYVADAEGRVDLYSWPSLNRMMIVLKHGRWNIKTDSGIDWPQAWGEQTLAELIQNLAAEA